MPGVTSQTSPAMAGPLIQAEVPAAWSSFVKAAFSRQLQTKAERWQEASCWMHAWGLAAGPRLGALG